MCYINGVRVSLETYIRYKQHEKELKHLQAALKNQPARKGFDYSDWPVIKPSIDGNDWNVMAMNWGFLPATVKTVQHAQRFRYGYTDEYGKYSAPFTTLNAKGEELLLPGKMFRQSALTGRCLILSSGFYEYRHQQVTGKRGNILKKAATYPYYITVPAKPYFMIAGVYNTFRDDESGEEIDTVAMITTDATEHPLMSQIHNSKLRMPVIFTDELAEEWTDKDLSEERIHQLANYKYDSKLMSAHTVSQDFLQQKEPATPFIYPELPQLIFDRKYDPQNRIRA